MNAHAVEGFLALKEPDKEIQMDEYGSSPRLPTRSWTVFPSSLICAHVINNLNNNVLKHD